MSDITSVKFRMYNTGSVGDCILLMFMKGTVPSFKMLIDCGGYNTTLSPIRSCVENIKKDCQGVIDVLVVTHEHLDHVSGFNQARAIFDTITIKEVWMSWIEDRTDRIAKILKERYGKKLSVLRRAAVAALKQIQSKERLKFEVVGFKDKFSNKRRRIEQIVELLDFEEGNMYDRKLGAGRLSNGDAMTYVKGRGEVVKYRKPGEVSKDLKGAEGCKFFMLGPPRDADMRFFKIVMKEEEMYHLAVSADNDENEINQDITVVKTGITLEEDVPPFGNEYLYSGKELKSWMKKYNSDDLKWRQIEEDWREAELNLAMRITNLTNNTSLAMAIELPGGNVILLPGDAQSGNWMGWHKKDVMDKLKSGGGRNTDELLANTVLYKVGHHSSHNGTASFSGLNKMNSEDLVACIPLIKDKIPNAWGPKNFPAKELYKVLIEKTKGRVIRVDEGIAKSSRAMRKRSELTMAGQKLFETNFRKGPCYVEYTIQVNKT